VSAQARRPWPLVVRRARPGDEEQVMSFSTNTWNGWDYMPRAWPRWIDAPDGVLLVGTVGGAGGPDVDGIPLDPGQVVAIVRVAMPAAGEAWWEGIRVDARVRGMDVATDLQVAEFAWSAANGAHIVRYATSGRNEGSHRLGARGGLEQIVEFMGVSWKQPSSGGDPHSDNDESSGFEPGVQAGARRRRHALLERLSQEGVIADPAMADVIWRGVSGDTTFNDGARLYEPRPWAMEELTEQKFLEHLRLGEVLHGEDADGGKAVAILVADVAPAESPALDLALVVGMPRAAFELVDRARRAAEEAIDFRYPSHAPLVSEVRQSYLDAGYELSDWALHIFARPIDAAHPMPPVEPAALVLADEPQPTVVPVR
jgi:hypothetical protein